MSTGTNHDITTEEWLAIRKVAAMGIEPAAAEILWVFTEIDDPYGVLPPAEESCNGRSYFARSPESDIWVSFDDLPDDVREMLYKKMG